MSFGIGRRMKSKDKRKYLNTLLEGEHLAEFERVKAYHGIKTNSDVVRFLIRQEARRVARESPAITMANPSPA